MTRFNVKSLEGAFTEWKTFIIEQRIDDNHDMIDKYNM